MDTDLDTSISYIYSFIHLYVACGLFLTGVFVLLPLAGDADPTLPYTLYMDIYLWI